jgi:membrane fusion protein, multidrug efflux system
MSNGKLATLILAALVVAGGAVIVHKKRALARLAHPATPAVAVTTALVRNGSVVGTLNTVALIESETAATVSAQVAGAILEVRVHEGDAVRRGETMVRIDPRVLDDNVQAAQARLAAAREDLAKQQAIFDRDSVLFANLAIGRQAFDVSKAQLEAVRAAEVTAARALASAQTLLSYAAVAAPYAGVVTARLVEPGDLAVPGKPLIGLQVPGPVRLISKLSQEVLGSLKVGDAVTLTLGDQRVTVRTTRIYPALDAAHLGTVETVLLAAPFGLPPGATLAASYATTASRGLVVPTSALLQGLRQTVVIGIRKGRTVAVPVVVVSDNGTAATVRGALAAGDTVVTGLPSELMSLTSGTPIVPQGDRP